MELRRQVLIKKLNDLGVFVSTDGRLLSSMTPDELELEYCRVQDREEKDKKC
ncbi:hypothetical protein [Anaerobacillus alkalilacustris]|uniref:hypothetical protein n=1 Tax=Anaerobacillus alkalilacustris TaxID=393763 RepID=UPI001471CAEC|nr:hypothetical protein [Anaerobacillus alkalilacustris]